MGDPEKQPPLPEFEFATVPPEQTYTSKRWQECNWLQAFEAESIGSHVSFLHSGGLKSDPLFKGTKGNEYNMGDLKPFFEVAESDGGLFVGARRNAEEDTYYWRITPWVMPCFTMVPPRGDHPVHGHFWIPIDDENCWTYSFDYHPVRARPLPRPGDGDGDGVDSENIRGTFRPAANKEQNDYPIDREAQKRGETYPCQGHRDEDVSLQEAWVHRRPHQETLVRPTAASSRRARSRSGPSRHRETRAERRRGWIRPIIVSGLRPLCAEGRVVVEACRDDLAVPRACGSRRHRPLRCPADAGSSWREGLTSAAETRYRIDRPICRRRGACIIGTRRWGGCDRGTDLARPWGTRGLLLAAEPVGDVGDRGSDSVGAE